MRQICRAMLLRILLLSAVQIVIATTLHAAARTALLTDTRIACAGCGGTAGITNYTTQMRTLYPNIKIIASYDEVPLRTGLQGSDALFIPFVYDKDLTQLMPEVSKNLLREFVQNGGRLLFKIDYRNTPRPVNNFVEQVFGIASSTVGSIDTPPSYTCDSRTATDLGWLETPTADQLNFVATVYVVPPVNLIPICRAGPSPGLVVVGAFPYGDGIIYFDGTLSNAANTITAKQKLLLQQMLESDLVGPHRCFVKDGGLRCSGGNSFGQLGVGDRVQHTNRFADLIAVDLGTTFGTVQRVASNSGSSCALSQNGQVKCWGVNKQGQLAQGDVLPRGDTPNALGNTLPVINFGNLRIRDLSVGHSHACAIADDNRLFCWGKGEKGQLGSEATLNIGDNPGEFPLAVNIAGNAKALAAGRSHTCVLLDAGNISCFGDNSLGQLGTGSNANIGDRPNTMGAALPRLNLGNDFVATAIAGGTYHTCALSEQGRIKCWGANDLGQLGQSSNVNSRGNAAADMGDNLPWTDLGEGQIATGLACGANHCCAVMLSNTLKCWGANESGQLGLGDTLTRGRGVDEMGDLLPFVEMPILERVQGLDLAGNTTCVTSESGTRCWGANNQGQLATGDRINRGDRIDTTPKWLDPIY